MLVLQVATQERVRITYADGTEIWLMVTSIRDRGRAKLGIDAPKNVRVIREALIDKSQEAKR